MRALPPIPEEVSEWAAALGPRFRPLTEAQRHLLGPLWSQRADATFLPAAKAHRFWPIGVEVRPSKFDPRICGSGPSGEIHQRFASWLAVPYTEVLADPPITRPLVESSKLKWLGLRRASPRSSRAEVISDEAYFLLQIEAEEEYQRLLAEEEVLRASKC